MNLLEKEGINSLVDPVFGANQINLWESLLFSCARKIYNEICDEYM
jgi:hypothetical protein